MTIHGADYQRAKWGPIARTILRLGERLGINSADAVICVAPSLTKRLQRHIRSGRAGSSFVPNGAPPLRATGNEAQVLRKFGLERGKFVLAVGRLEPGKGFELLIEAFRRSRSTRKLVIVGGAPPRGRISARAHESRGRQIVFAGMQPREVLAHLYRNAALFVLPSLHEGLPICALEAGSVGCPLLLSDIPGNRDLGLPKQHYFASGRRRQPEPRIDASAGNLCRDTGMFSRVRLAEDLDNTARDLRVRSARPPAEVYAEA